jgi:hypothetical protein
MTPRLQILRDLLASPSTTDAIQCHTDIPEADIKAILADEEIAGTVTSYPLHMLTVWRLTGRGTEIAVTLPPAPSYF